MRTYNVSRYTERAAIGGAGLMINKFIRAERRKACIIILKVTRIPQMAILRT